ncbi:MAG: hypothetical protein M3416_15515 [Acidobacteriota bacterium]|nr:hypothetical protein [Acidobacteriota bacterium]
MHHIRLRLAAGLLTFVVGTSLAYYARRPGGAPGGFRTAAECRAVLVVNHPSTSLLHPLETTESRRLD